MGWIPFLAGRRVSATCNYILYIIFFLVQIHFEYVCILYVCLYIYDFYFDYVAYV